MSADKSPLPPPPANLPKVGETYRHYKGTLYVMTGISRDEADPESFRVSYNRFIDPEPIDWSRTFFDWANHVKVAGDGPVLGGLPEIRRVPRFVRELPGSLKP